MAIFRSAESRIGMQRRRSIAEVALRGRQAVTRRIERLQAWRAGFPSYDHYDSVVVPDLYQTFPSLGPEGAGPSRIARAIADMDVSTLDALRRQSDALEDGRVELLGHGSLHIGSAPNWHREPVLGLEVPRLHWSRIDHLDTNLVGDHKVLWELNRLQYLVAPAFCWLVDRDRRRIEFIERHLNSWLKENPPRLGVNWASSLEVAYRAIAWCWLLWLLRDAPWQDALRERLAAALEISGRHIERYLSTYFSPNTHLTGEALGLFYIGTILPGSVHSSRWRRKGAEILEAWVDRHVLADGVYFEQSTQYHRYTTEIYLHYEMLSRGTAWRISPRVRLALFRLFDVLRAVTDGAGFIPLSGDDDGGFLLPFDHRRPDDVGSLLLCGAVALDRPDLIAGIRSSSAMAYWLCGLQSTDWLLQEPARSPDWRDMYFPNGGTAVLRDGWEARDAVAVIDAGPHGFGSCAHGHADALAMTLSVGAQALFVDRGTFTYSGAERNQFRATASHNTLEIDGESGVEPTEPFRWRDIPPRAQGTVYASRGWSGFVGVAPGHAGARPSEHHRRTLHLRHGGWLILDRGSRRGARTAIVRWQLAPGLDVQRIGPFALCIVSGERLVATLFALLCKRVDVGSRTVSQRLGHQTVAPVIELDLGPALEAMTVVIPAHEGYDAPVLETGEASGTYWNWQDHLGRHRISLGKPSVPANLGLTQSGLCWTFSAEEGSATEIAILPIDTVPDQAEGHSGLQVWRGIMGEWQRIEVAAPCYRQA